MRSKVRTKIKGPGIALLVGVALSSLGLGLPAAIHLTPTDGLALTAAGLLLVLFAPVWLFGPWPRRGKTRLSESGKVVFRGDEVEMFPLMNTLGASVGPPGPGQKVYYAEALPKATDLGRRCSELSRELHLLVAEHPNDWVAVDRTYQQDYSHRVLAVVRECTLARVRFNLRERICRDPRGTGDIRRVAQELGVTASHLGVP